MSPLEISALILSMAAIGGAVLAAIRLRGAPYPPLALAHGHGAIAAAGVITLAYAAYSAGIPQLAQIALGIFVLAALGGAVMMGLFHLKSKPLPIPLVLGHGILALVGLGLLLKSVYGG